MSAPPLSAAQRAHALRELLAAPVGEEARSRAQEAREAARLGALAAAVGDQTGGMATRELRRLALTASLFCEMRTLETGGAADGAADGRAAPRLVDCARALTHVRGMGALERADVRGAETSIEVIVYP